MRYCIGDVHGCAKTLKAITERIIENDPEAAFYFVGDLIDRGPDSKEVIDYMFRLEEKGHTLKCIMGNHEQMFLEAYEQNLPVDSSNWAYNGAETTIASFKESYSLNQSPQKHIPERYYQYIKSFPYYIELKDFFIVHAGFNFHASEPFEDVDFMLWTRKEENDEKFTGGKKIIHGHTPIPKQEIQTKLDDADCPVINVDSGCVYIQRPGLGYLTALNLDTMETISTKNIDMMA